MTDPSAFTLSDEERRLFLEETSEHLTVLEEGLLKMERQGADAGLLAEVFRSAHSVKGAAGIAGITAMEQLAHQLENLLDQIRSGARPVTPGAVDAMLQAVDCLRRMTDALDQGLPLPEPPAGVLEALRAGGDQAPGDGGGPEATAAPAGALPQDLPEGWTHLVRVHIDEASPLPAARALQAFLEAQRHARILWSDPPEDALETGQGDRSLVLAVEASDAGVLERALRSVPEVVGVQVEARPSAVDQGAGRAPAAAAPAGTTAGPAAEAADAAQPAGAPAVDRSVRVDVSLLDELMNLVGELVVDRGQLDDIAEILRAERHSHEVAARLTQVTERIGRVTAALQSTVLRARMLPVERIFSKFPRLVRDVSRQLGKKVELIITGEDTELDRRVLQQIGDPLMHLIRNALDHGLETPEERQQAGKPPVGRLHLSAHHANNRVIITVADDGRGIDARRVVAKAVDRGLVSPQRAQELTETEIYQLLFMPGFSTAESVSNLSGRGVGLDVVRRNIEGLGGQVSVQSAPGQGTTFSLSLPLTLATIRALLVEAGGQVVALPLDAVTEAVRVRADQIETLRQQPVVQVRGHVVPLYALETYLNPSAARRGATLGDDIIVVLVPLGSRYVGIVVDRIVGDREIVVKGLGKALGQIQGLTGATILGDGTVAVIIDPAAVVAALRAEAAGAAVRTGAARAV